MMIILLCLISLFIISSDSFWNLWLSLELFSFFLLPWLMEGESKVSKVYVFLYFLTQFTASIGLLVSTMSFLNKTSSTLAFVSLLIKMACFPFHSWFVGVVPHLSWKKIVLLTTLSKFVPLAMLVFMTPPQGFIWILSLGLAMALGGFNTNSLPKIATFSSVAHSSWLVICTCMDKTLSIYYILSYIVISIPLGVFFFMEELSSIKASLQAKNGQVGLIVSLLTLSGIPPFLGFIPKFLTIQALVQAGALMEASFLGILSILPLFFYFKASLLSFSMSTGLEFGFSNSVSSMIIFLSGISILVFICLTLELSLIIKMLICQVKEKCSSLMMAKGYTQVETEFNHHFTLKESKSFSEVMSPLAYGV